jgi:hypothetical protein
VGNETRASLLSVSSLSVHRYISQEFPLRAANRCAVYSVPKQPIARTELQVGRGHERTAARSHARAVFHGVLGTVQDQETGEATRPGERAESINTRNSNTVERPVRCSLRQIQNTPRKTVP